MNIYQNRVLAQPLAHTRFLETDRSLSTFSLRCREDGTFAFNETTDQWPRCLQGEMGTSAANQLIGEVVQLRRRPLLGPSPG